MKTATQFNSERATVRAMESQIPFSWLRNRKVQAGVYLDYSQEFFHQYKLPAVFVGMDTGADNDGEPMACYSNVTL
ncbi:MAG: hypothetical protein JWR85_4223 [Marmoricola sp.]|nr:hypothetical protein [Marmoricola sp.]